VCVFALCLSVCMCCVCYSFFFFFFQFVKESVEVKEDESLLPIKAKLNELWVSFMADQAVQAEIPNATQVNITLHGHTTHMQTTPKDHTPHTR